MSQVKHIFMYKKMARKVAVIFFLALYGSAAFATLGEGRSKATLPGASFLSHKKNSRPGVFSLQSGYAYQGNLIIKPENEKKYINLNTIVTLPKENAVYIFPLKKKVILKNIKIDIGNRQFQKN